MLEADNPILIRYLGPSNFLSFGRGFDGIDLKSLNIIIGPNGSGKSNLIEAINLMRSAPKDFRDVTRKGGGANEWIWKGSIESNACIECELNYSKGPASLYHIVRFHNVAQAFSLTEEHVIEGGPRPSNKDKRDQVFYQYEQGQATVHSNRLGEQRLDGALVDPNRSILAQLRDATSYPELAWLAEGYEKIRIYREWAFGRSAIFREPQKADSRNDMLEEDFSNLGLFLNRLKTRFPVAKKAILSALKDLYDGVDDFDVFIEGGTVQVFFSEGDFVIPATRLSDGTLRYLCLLAILCDPEPPPLICIEEPELGLHPDILPKVADLLRSASHRTQLIVTTHSDILVDAMTDTPESIIVCSKSRGKTEMKRLVPDELSQWLTKYRLGQLWTQGEIGGTRW